MGLEVALRKEAVALMRRQPFLAAVPVICFGAGGTLHAGRVGARWETAHAGLLCGDRDTVRAQGIRQVWDEGSPLFIAQLVALREVGTTKAPLAQVPAQELNLGREEH